MKVRWKVNWKEVCKFLSGAAFAGMLANGYLYITNTPVPFIGFSIAPGFLGMRALALLILFLVFFYIGFMKK